MNCNTSQTSGGDPCDPKHDGYSYKEVVHGVTIESESYSYVSCTCWDSSAGDVSCELTAAPSWC